jgi:Bacterial protein of unknown function (DUF839)
MSRLSSFLLSGALCVAAAACSPDQAPTPTEVSADARRGPPPAGFITSQPAQAEAVVPNAVVKPIISTGDLMPGSNEPWGPIPDGLGAYSERGDLFVFANHELSASGVTSSNGGPAFTYARVSKLQLDRRSLSVVSGRNVEDGRSLLLRLCSATWVDIDENFPTGYFLTGEESSPTPSGSIVSAIDRNGNRTPLPHLGSFSHENQIAVPGFGRRVVSIGFDDTNAASELYMYVASNEAAFIAGTGKLYVFKTAVKSAAGNPLHSGNMIDGQTIAGEFVEITDPADLGSPMAARFANLQAKADRLGAMPFVRIEDGDYAKRNDPRDRSDDDDAVDEAEDDGQRSAGRDRDRDRDRAAPAIYFVDTGSPTTSGRTQVGASCGGPCDPAGSLYRMEFDRRDPTKNATLTLLKRSKGAALGWASPDNIATTRTSIMIMEDPAYPGFDGSRAPAIFNMRFRRGGRVVTAERKVVQTTQETLIPGPAGKCVDTAGQCWETSGIISTERWLGEGSWLFVVQAHTLPFSVTKSGTTSTYRNEGGQLLYLRVPGT